MIKVTQLKNAYRIYSTENKQIKHTKSGSVHSEYVVRKEPNISDYEEMED